MEIQLSASELSELELLSKKTQERWVYIRLRVIILSHKGWSGLMISEILGIDEGSVYSYQKSYTSLGLADYLKRGYIGFIGRLDYTQLSKVRKELKSRLYRSSSEVGAYIFSSFGVKYTANGVSSLLHRINFSYKKTKQVPCEANKAKQEAFIEDLSEKLGKQEAENSVIYFTDGVHPSHNTRSTYGWIETGTEFELETLSGRDRININGAINAQNPTEIHTVIDESVNAQSTISLFEKILAANPHNDKIYIISDNAKYYRSKILKEWVENNPKIVHIFLPPYSQTSIPLNVCGSSYGIKPLMLSFTELRNSSGQELSPFFKILLNMIKSYALSLP